VASPHSDGDAGHALSIAAAFERCPDPALLFDHEARLAWRNPAAAAPAVGDPPAGLVDAVKRALATQAAVSFAWGRTGPGGTETWLDAVVTPVAVADRALALVVCRDVAAARREEERLRRSEQLMVDTQGVAHLGTWEWDIALPTATWSAELYRIYGLTPETYTPTYEGYLLMVHPDDRQRVIDATNAVFHQHVPYSHDERIFRPDGTMRFLHTWAQPILDEHGTLRRLVGVCQDITDQKLAEAALQSLNAELEQRIDARTAELQRALHDLETFNAMVSHDLRNPLSVIQMTAHALGRLAASPEQAEPLVGRIKRAVASMTRLLDDLVALERIAQGGIEPAAIAVDDLVRELEGEQRVAYPEHPVELVIHDPVLVHADRTLFRAVLANLIGNAWKYTAGAEGPRIDVGRAARPTGHALYVRDNGIGFDMSEYDQLFAPFTRLANAQSFAGLGIGLATVQRIVELHGGRVEAEGEPGRGATFFVVLPDRCWT
jgi:PAS domain S-box-containing protein